jgi:uncharacterized protein with HEPN domain
MHQDKVTFLDIAEAALLILSFVKDVPREEFLEDAKTQSAMIHQLLVLGAATKRLTPEF